MDIYLVAAVARDGAIGQAGRLPWPELREDMRWFLDLTTRVDPMEYAGWRMGEEMDFPEFIPTESNSVIMGRRTWQSLPVTALLWRLNLVLSRDRAWRAAVPVRSVATLQDALDFALGYGAPNAFVIGGAQVYAKALQLPELRTMFITEVGAEFPQADTWFPQWQAFDWQRSTAWLDHRTDEARAKDAYGTYTYVPWRRAINGPWFEQEGLRFRFTVWRRA